MSIAMQGEMFRDSACSSEIEEKSVQDPIACGMVLEIAAIEENLISVLCVCERERDSRV